MLGRQSVNLLSIDVICRLLITLHVSAAEVPCTVVVDKAVEVISCVGIWSRRITSGSTIEMLAWSSRIAKPSIKCFEDGCVSFTGQVLL